MSFLLGRSEEQVLLAETLQRLGRKRNGFEDRRRRLSGSVPDRMALWPDLAAIGAFGLAFPETAGGFGGVPLDLAVLVDALAPSLAVEPVIPTLVTAGRILGGAGHAELIGSTIDGSRVPMLAHVEGFDAFGPPREMTARAAPGGYVIDGRKPAVRNADVATDFLVSARMPDGTVAVFAIGRETEGLHLEPTRLIDGAGAADLTLAGVRVREADKLPLAEAMTTIVDALEWTLMALAVETASLIGAANAATFGYLNVREQFGQKLARFQALQHKAADMAVAQAEAEAVAMRAVGLLRQPSGPARSRALLLASLASDAAWRLVGHSAIQLHGGMGVSDELAISHFGRRFAAIRTQVANADARQVRLLEVVGESS